MGSVVILIAAKVLVKIFPRTALWRITKSSSLLSCQFHEKLMTGENMIDNTHGPEQWNVCTMKTHCTVELNVIIT